MPAPKIISVLIERFEQNKHSYKTGVYNEAQVRQEFINPFFNALGWDVYNNKGYAEAYKDVIHEYSQKTFTGINAPDYGFRIGGQLKFFVEAKKPGINIKDDIQPAYQLRRYAWSSKLPLSILTDFEEFAVYDCRILPKASDKASAGRILYYSYADYLERWDEIENIFSPEAIKKGSFDRYAASNKNKRGTAEVDEKFLEVLKEWREVLARNIALRNPLITARELNFAVQKTIDRIIFLRICEDRGIEEYGQLNALQNGENVYKRLLQLFTRADEKYNSGLFHFEKERDRSEEPDSITTNIEIDDKLLKDIFKHLYYPHSPFEFSVLPADILGQVYEQFLGKVIRLTNGHQAKVEDKPEVKKAGGVFYTPTYIVNYIVENTLGRLLGNAGAEPVKKNLTPKEVSKIKILDPACGSGSFLIVAYQYLLEWHLKYYTAPENLAAALKKNYVFETQKGEYRLTTGERKRILLNNIYGVDIDSQAVEVTKLSLLLKVLEGETDETLTNQMKFFRERALPDLGSNIKCGNSLIGPDFYDQMEMNFLDDEEKLRINVFDWQHEFKDIMNSGGFDVVIGNPPYGALFMREELNYLKTNFKSAFAEIDSYLLFIEKAITLTKRNHLLAYIIPDTWLTLVNAESFRKYILENTQIDSLIALNESVFLNATVDPLLLFISNNHPNPKNETSIYASNKKDKLKSKMDWKLVGHINQQKWLLEKRFQINIYLTEEAEILINKIKINSLNLNDLVEYRAGCKPYEKGKGRPPQTASTLKNKPFTSFNKKEDWKILIRGNDIKRYQLNIKKAEWILYGEWLAAPRELKIFTSPRILIQAIRNPSLETRILATYSDKEYISRINVYTLLLDGKTNHSYHQILGILNSKLMNWAIKKIYGLHTYIITGLLQLPIKKIEDFNKDIFNYIDEKAKSLEDTFISYHNSKTPQEKTALQRQIDAVDRQIDNLVYRLYGLTEEEIKIVEGE